MGNDACQQTEVSRQIQGAHATIATDAETRHDVSATCYPPTCPQSISSNGQNNNNNATMQDPGHLFDGVDRTEADLGWDAPGPDDINPRTGERWLYPKKIGRHGPSNLEAFKEEIIERTRNGQGCKAIAEALIEKGVDTNSKSVSAQRLRWGVREKVGLPLHQPGEKLQQSLNYLLMYLPLVFAGTAEGDTTSHCQHQQGPPRTKGARGQHSPRPEAPEETADTQDAPRGDPPHDRGRNVQ